ncbi:MAG: sodium/glutamate symporter [Pseudomonadota bacterium]
MIELDYRRTLILAILVLFAGKLLTRKIAFLQENNIPEPVTGGVLAAALVAAIYLSFDLTFQFALEIRDGLLLTFFTIIGLSTRFDKLIAGGKSLVILLVLVVAFLFIQNTTGALVALVTGFDPLAGLLGGSVSFSGGHGTTIAWAPVFGEDYGYSKAMEAGVAFATFGLVIGGLLGGPIARYLIQRFSLQSSSKDPIEVGFKYEQRGQQIGVDEILMVLLAIAVAIGLGLHLDQLLEYWGIKLPLFVSCLFSGIVLTNIIPLLFKKVPCPSGTPALALMSELSLGLFLAISLMSLRLWELTSLAGPVMLLVFTQVVVVTVYAVFVVYRVMGRDYDAAVISSGFIGLSLGAVPTAIANMSAVTKRFGAANQAFIVIPLIGAFFLDITNSIVIQTFIEWLE